ncbi:hypothetical protein PDESU_01669 [Pontiella desulfatans]|uniref:Uncharacterized protein n=1 Tax=Pontiella desulfatans TaxID=2750659 RepID=A0A6C2TZT1_PONDE|nr:hypothetical protein [Pontiella desulfatans]VGO13115.1 hypothetical protein PDESU_01669 [Pontiella desulfatans]
MPARKNQILMSIAVLAAIAWLFRPNRDHAGATAETPPAIAKRTELKSIRPEAVPEPVEEMEPLPPSVDARSPAEEEAQPEQADELEGPEVSAEAATEPILHLLPDWMLESGDMRRERIQIAGHWVDRVRSRYAWPNGSLVEVEVSDLGSDAREEHFKALGFDFDLREEATNGTLRLAMDGADIISNLEYSEDDGSGHVQYIVSGRYLMEVQIQSLPQECFQTLEDRDRLLETLQQHASEQTAK